MINVLFVDDEPNILDGLKRMLRPMRREWQMSFADGGAKALETLDREAFDVVVSDMRMPGMDGARLLHEVREKHPHVVRLILSGYSEKEMIMKSVGAAHQYLAKPCDAEILKATIERACRWRDLVADENLRRLVSQLDSIPSLPALYHELLNELQAGEPSIKRIAEIVAKDIGMTAKVLQIINSAFFGLRRQISNPSEAVEFLGLETITSLALELRAFSPFENASAGNLSLADLWSHSQAVGGLAKQIAAAEKPETAGDAFTAGLLHDIGKIVLANDLPDQYAEAAKLAAAEKLSISEAEKKVFGASHAEIGAYLLGLWGLPAEVVEAVAFHHKPSEIESHSFTVLTAIHAAEALTDADSKTNETVGIFYDELYLEKLGLLEKPAIWQAVSARAGLEEITI